MTKKPLLTEKDYKRRKTGGMKMVREELSIAKVIHT